MKATELLQKQHREIEQLLERLRTAGPENEGAIRRELADLLVAHTVIEQEHFYPSMRELAPERILEALEEHGLVEFQLARELSTRPGDANARARSVVLGDVLLAHIRKEENDLFRRAESALTNQELAEIGEVMMVSFERAQRQGWERILAHSLAAHMPRLAARSIQRTKSARRGQAKKKTTARRAATTAKRGTARKAQGARGTTKRAAPARSTAKRGTTKRGTTKRATTTKRGSAGARSATQRAATAARGSTKGSRGMRRTGARGTKSRAAR